MYVYPLCHTQHTKTPCILIKCRGRNRPLCKIWLHGVDDGQNVQGIGQNQMLWKLQITLLKKPCFASKHIIQNCIKGSCSIWPLGTMHTYTLECVDPTDGGGGVWRIGVVLIPDVIVRLTGQQTNHATSKLLTL